MNGVLCVHMNICFYDNADIFQIKDGLMIFEAASGRRVTPSQRPSDHMPCLNSVRNAVRISLGGQGVRSV